MFRGNLLFFISCVAVATAFECGQRVAPTRHKRIANGYKAGHWPWTVLLLSDPEHDDSGEMFCGGSVIGSRWVLTAAHCVRNVSADTIHLVVGETNMREANNSKSVAFRRAVSIILFDELYENVNKSRHDVAVIELHQPLDFTEHIRPICLPSRADPIYEKGAELVAIGHGETRPFYVPTDTPPVVDPFILQEIKLIADDPAHCKERLLEKELEDNSEEDDEEDGDFDLMDYLDEEVRLNICMKEKGIVKGTCSGDSGGPLMLKTKDEKWFQFGINYYGTPGDRCGDPTEVEVFANVAVHCDFIALATDGEVTCTDVK